MSAPQSLAAPQDAPHVPSDKAEPDQVHAKPVKGRILWLALGDARGHVMRALTIRKVLAQHGIVVDIVTTNEEARDFLRSFGVEAEMLSPTYGAVMDARQDMDKMRTEIKTLLYMFLPTRLMRDMAWLRDRGQHYDLVVNDSFHVALLFGTKLESWQGIRLVQVYGKYMRKAVLGQFEGGRGPRFWANFYSNTLADLVDSSFARVEHTFDASDQGQHIGHWHRLPPLIPDTPADRGQLRAKLGVPEGKMLAVAYLNPNFRDPQIAQAVEDAIAAHGSHPHLVGEGYAAQGRPGWLAYDQRLVDSIAAADLLFSAPGMGVLAQARLFETPLVAVMTSQPEQQSNLNFLEQGAGHPYEAVQVSPVDSLVQRMEVAVKRLQGRLDPNHHRPPAQAAVAARQQLWVDVFAGLVGDAQAEREALGEA